MAYRTMLIKASTKTKLVSGRTVAYSKCPLYIPRVLARAEILPESNRGPIIFALLLYILLHVMLDITSVPGTTQSRQHHYLLTLNLSKVFRVIVARAELSPTRRASRRGLLYVGLVLGLVEKAWQN